MLYKTFDKAIEFGGGGANGGGCGGGGGDGGVSQEDFSSNVNSQKRGIPVENARKIWGTLKSTTCFAVTNVIRRPTSQSLSKLAVKWKHKTNTDGSIKNGEQEWDIIATHIYWLEAGGGISI